MLVLLCLAGGYAEGSCYYNDLNDVQYHCIHLNKNCTIVLVNLNFCSSFKKIPKPFKKAHNMTRFAAAICLPHGFTASISCTGISAEQRSAKFYIASGIL